jgi:hypothetical protein
VVRVVLAGDSFAPGTSSAVSSGKLSKKQQADVKAPLAQLDLALAQVSTLKWPHPGTHAHRHP